MRDCILDDDRLDFLRLDNRHAHSHRPAVVVQEQGVAMEIQRLRELLRHLGKKVEGVAELFRAWPGRMSEARKVWRDETIPRAQS